MDVKLVVQRSGGPPQAFRLRGPEMIVGRQKGSGVRIPSGEVSRQHCSLVWQGELLRVEDLTSANGTWVNGQRITRRQILRPGDKLRVGPITFVVHYQLSQTALDQLLQENEEQPAAMNLDDVEVIGDGMAPVELVLDDGDDQGPLLVDDENSLGPPDPLEALRQIEEVASGKPAAGPPPLKKKTTPPPVKKTTPPARPARPPLPPRQPAFDEVEVLDPAAAPPRPPAKRVKFSRPAASDDEPVTVSPEEGDAAAAHPDASMILGHKNWEAPAAGQDLRDILAQLEKGKKV